MLKYWNLTFLFVCRYENETSKDPIKEAAKPPFNDTIIFVEDYLRNVVAHSWAFTDRQQNLLTFQVKFLLMPCKRDGKLLLWKAFIEWFIVLLRTLTDFVLQSLLERPH